jgi:hypothetical protein
MYLRIVLSNSPYPISGRLATVKRYIESSRNKFVDLLSNVFNLAKIDHFTTLLLSTL